LKLLLDMNVTPRLVSFLTTSGVDSAHWQEVGRASAEDSDIADFAAEHDLTVVTHDLDFGALLSRTGRRSPSVIQIRADDLSVEQLGDKIVWLVENYAEEIAGGALVTLDLLRVRIRILPITPQ
jgi:predicted nuclease of predicted toxin-antitoxin system